jgi:hypothetical protein
MLGGRNCSHGHGVNLINLLYYCLNFCMYCIAYVRIPFKRRETRRTADKTTNDDK